MTDQPPVHVDGDGVVHIGPLALTQRQWAVLTLEVDSALCIRQMDQSERIRLEGYDDVDLDWLDRAEACWDGREAMNWERGLYGIDPWPESAEAHRADDYDHQIRVVTHEEIPF